MILFFRTEDSNPDKLRDLRFIVSSLLGFSLSQKKKGINRKVIWETWVLRDHET